MKTHAAPSSIRLRLEPLLRSRLDPFWKGVPPEATTLCIGDVGQQGWSLLRGSVPLPLAVLRESALTRNSHWMKGFLGRHGCVLSPHGKTTMAPQLFQRQFDDGAWGMTAATPAQVRIYRRFGVPRILLANQLVDPHGIAFILDELKRDPGFDFYCLVDSPRGVESLAAAVKRFSPGRPLQVLVELGAAGGRTGVRGTNECVTLARAVARSPELSIRGVETYEAVFPTDQAESGIRQLLDDLKSVLGHARHENLFAPGPIIVTAGGSQYFDLVARELHACATDPMLLVLRSGCYLTHDVGMYERAFENIQRRSGTGTDFAPPPIGALEVWSHIQSCPEPGKAIASFGKRDVSYDVDLPKPLWWFRPGTHQSPLPVEGRCRISKLNDQHAHLELTKEFEPAVGDLLGVGISHPCTTFDKWNLIYVVDDRYNIIGAIRTYFG